MKITIKFSIEIPTEFAIPQFLGHMCILMWLDINKMNTKSNE